jgi:hypothetical protein
MWTVAPDPESVVETLKTTPEWPREARGFAALR